MKLAPHRVLIVVSDMERTLRFYRDQLGMKVVRDAIREGASYDQITGIRNVLLRVVFVEAQKGGHLMELAQYLKPKSRCRPRKMSDVGAARICFAVPNVSRAVAALRKRGIKSCRGPILLQRDGIKIAKLLYLNDPDGIEIELIEMLQS